MLGGRAAEEIVYGTETTGAENDIEQATDLAHRKQLDALADVMLAREALNELEILDVTEFPSARLLDSGVLSASLSLATSADSTRGFSSPSSQ